ncbi:glycoside hydrolase family 15 protein [Carboxydochorda subterranea]|uniref:Glycoside hydrolase family 15 protein n=1 Tax=Carboxydichorda subterranea TaxID=3109565 RepID=A0ABZ1BZL0_9FIRM|nr:glycoside hydrolase family 15 protein [Limnochorda sp. L945t]WRP18188.1 glycoside hydrolase family 15 protein [Limnochorda sp. L945t]
MTAFPAPAPAPSPAEDPADAGVVGNGQTVAIIARTGAVTWWCLPRVDGHPVLARALDPSRGGMLDVTPASPRSLSSRLAGARQAYYDGSTVLVTRWKAGGGAVAAVDFMPWGKPALVREVWASAPSPLESLVLRLTVTRAAVAGRWAAAGGDPAALLTEDSPEAAMAFALAPGSTSAPPQASWEPGTGTLEIRWKPAGSWDPGRPAPPHPLLDGLRPVARLAVGYGRTVDQARSAAAALSRLSPEEGVCESREWLSRAVVPQGMSPGHLAAFRRSLLTLRLLTYPETGAIVAAPTASWPATPGGSDNWDYRFTWLRDGAWTAWALDRAGFHREARAFYRFAARLQAADGHWSQPLYAVDGRLPVEFDAPELSGPGGERPVRFGNAAAHQLQLDNEGNVLWGVQAHVELTGDQQLLWETWDMVKRAALWVEAHWRMPESGIWELREFTGHWVHGTSMAAVALASAARLARRAGTGEEAARRWEGLAREIARQALDHAWSARRGALMRLFTPQGPDESQVLDISVLTPLLWHLADARDPRLVATIEAMHRSPAEGGLTVRAPSAARGGEGLLRFGDGALPFYMAGFWMVRALHRMGRDRQAVALLDRLLEGANPLGLMGEHHDPATGRQWGNFPQAFSHEELIHALYELYEPG